MKYLSSIAFSALIAGLCLCTSHLRADGLNNLQTSFSQPPDDSRIMMRWWWFGPSVTKAEIERELKVMKDGGIGGVEVQPTYPLSLDDETKGIKNFKLMSSEYLDALTFTAAKAKELGMRMDLTLGSGWPYGGSQFPPSEAAGRIRVVNVDVDAAKNSVPLPKLSEGEKAFAAFLGPMQNVPDGGYPFKEMEIRDGAAQLPSDRNGATRLSFFIASQTKMKVKRAAYGNEGFVIDHYNPTVVDKFIKEIAEPSLKACGPNPPYAVFCDSLEVAGEDWTSNFLEEFKKRRGYDLRPYLPSLFNNIGPKSADIRHDWGKTLTEVFNDNFISIFEKWAKDNGSKFRIQAYGTPPAALYSYAYADLGEGEGYTWKGFRESRWAASANHLLDRPVTSSETWTWLHSPVFRATPLDVKAEANLHFLQGVNQLIGHGWPYTAPGVEYPGWRFYAACAFGEKNPWWIVMPDLSKYLQRVSFMMRQGKPANDVALYMANSDAWANFTPGKVAMNSAVSSRLGKEAIRQILEAGYNLDFFDDGLLEMRGNIDNGTLTFGNLKYKVVVLAGVERIPPSTMVKLQQFAKNGGILIATRSIPSLAPGFKATEEDQKTVGTISEQLFKSPNAPGIFIQSDKALGETIAKRLSPDVGLEPASPDIGFVHRKSDSDEIYFIANTANSAINVKATFRIDGMKPELWDPMTGKVTSADIITQSKNATTVKLELEPYASTIVVFSKRTLPAQPPVQLAAQVPQSIDLSSGWNVTFGKDSKPVVMDKLNSWTVDENTKYFSGVAVYEKKVSIPSEMLANGLALRLLVGESKSIAKELTADNNPADINVPPAGADPVKAPTKPGPRMQAVIDAPVRDAAVVYVNGKRAGSIWCPPYSVDITGLLQSGDNDIRIEVANLAVNYMSDFKNHPLPDYKDLIARFGDRFQPQDMNKIQPVPSGLLGPIRIIASEKTSP